MSGQIGNSAVQRELIFDFSPGLVGMDVFTGRSVPG
jgi:hypothetical protein